MGQNNKRTEETSYPETLSLWVFFHKFPHSHLTRYAAQNNMWRFGPSLATICDSKPNNGIATKNKVLRRLGFGLNNAVSPRCIWIGIEATNGL